jgi:predicted RNase H-like HicB family nuclease
MKIEIEREDDGRWIAEIPELPGVMAYGDSRKEAISKAEALALRVLADRLEHGEEIPELKEVFAFHDREEIGPKMLARIAKHTGLTPEDL